MRSIEEVPMFKFFSVGAGVGILALALLSMSATADETVTRTVVDKSDSYIHFAPYYIRQDEDRRILENFGGGIRFAYGRKLDDHVAIEFNAAAAVLETGVKTFTDFYQYQLGVDAAYRFGEPGGFRPFVLAGIGAVHDDVFPNSRDETSFFANVGAGFVTGEMGNSGLRFRAEARYVHSEFDEGYQDWHVAVGLEVPLGRRIIERRVVERTEVVEVEVETEPVVTERRCEATLPDLKVDEFGCALGDQPLQHGGINYEINSARLTPESIDNLRVIAQLLQEQPDRKLLISGHTDSTGNPDHNMRLSQERAESVKLFLVYEGIEPARLEARGYGIEQPVASNATVAGRALNRRVELFLM